MTSTPVGSEGQPTRAISVAESAAAAAEKSPAAAADRIQIGGQALPRIEHAAQGPAEGADLDRVEVQCGQVVAEAGRGGEGNAGSRRIGIRDWPTEVRRMPLAAFAIWSELRRSQTDQSLSCSTIA